MSSVTDRLARALIWLHPPAWRRRHAAEVRALLDAAPATIWSVADLTRSMTGEWRLAWWRSATTRRAGVPPEIRSTRESDRRSAWLTSRLRRRALDAVTA